MKSSMLLNDPSCDQTNCCLASDIKSMSLMKADTLRDTKNDHVIYVIELMVFSLIVKLIR